MLTLVLIVTIISLFIPLYVYIGYPLLLIFLTKVLKINKPYNKKNITPKVALLVSCYNEVDVVREKITNCLNLDYPKEHLEIIFISDGSDDGTDEIIKEYAEQGIKLVRQEGRLGKTMALNMAIQETSSEFIVFSDANAMYKTDAINKLLRNFIDPSIGYVVGAALYTDGQESSAAESEDSYWQYEIMLKKMETQLHSVVGGDGAIYAIRKELYEELEQQDINDFVNPLQIIARGYRGVFEEQAICYEETAGDFNKEAKRKQRIVNRSFTGLMKVKQVLNPFKSGFFSFEVFSHKLLRWLIPIFLILSALGTIILAYNDSMIFKLLLLGEILFFWLAMLGYLQSHSKQIPAAFFYPFYFLMVNTYSLFGLWQAILGNVQITWSTPRAQQDKKNNPFKKQIIMSALFLSTLYLLIDVLLFN